MQIKYWQNFYKRKNSTRQPLSGTTANVVLKEPTSYWNPEIECVGVPRDANYFMIESGTFLLTFDAYYFVTDVISVTHAVTRFKLTLDRLDTYKTAIRNTTAYVLRVSDATKFNPLITDELNAPTGQVFTYLATTVLKYGSNITLFDGVGYNLLGVVGAPPVSGAAGSSNGIARFYLLSNAAMAQVAINLNQHSFLEDLKSELNNPLSAILGATYLPINGAGLAMYTEEIKFGSYGTGFNGNVLAQRILEVTQDLTLPSQLTGQQTYLLRAPYVTTFIYLPGVGVCPLDCAELGGTTTLSLRVRIDCFTGDIAYGIVDKVNGTILQTFAGNVGVELPVTGGSKSALARAAGIVSTIGGVATMNVGLIAAGAAALAKSFEVHTQINGALSSAVGTAIGHNVIVGAVIKTPAHTIADNAATEGLPYEKSALLSTLTGYVVCRNASVEIPGSDQDKEIVNNYLNTGIYLE